MIVQHNIMALNSHRYLSGNDSGLRKNLEKLSSGYRINRAADDAAGLSISQRMRAQIAGLERAQLNTKDGASLIQTAEGALTEVHSMLNRMKELGTQAANGTMGEIDRDKIESELGALKEEIDRISESTNFNGINLLDGSLSNVAPKDIEVKGVKVTETAARAGVYVMSDSQGTVYDGSTTVVGGDTFTYTVSLNNNDSFAFKFTISTDGKYLMAEDGTNYEMGTANEFDTEVFNDALHDQLGKSKLADNFIIDMTNDTQITFTNRAVGNAAPRVTGATLQRHSSASMAPDEMQSIAFDTQTTPADASSTILTANMSFFSVSDGGGITNEKTATFSVNGTNFILMSGDTAEIESQMAKLESRDVVVIKSDGSLNANDLKEMAAQINQATGMEFRQVADGLLVQAPKVGNGLTMQVGDTAEEFNKITVSVDDMSSRGLGIESITMTTQEAAARALDRVNAAIEKVSVNRGNLGALQNRLEHTLNNLSVTTENLTESESRIRDTDMAKEMMTFTKNNVLSQAAQAMLAQANQQPQQVLQLLR